MSSEFECALRDQVILGLANDLDFKAAFASDEHKKGVFHSDPTRKATYNYLFRAVEKRIKRSLGTDQKLWAEKAKKKIQSQSVSPSKPVTPPLEKLPVHRRAFTGQMAAAGERPEDYD